MVEVLRLMVSGFWTFLGLSCVGLFVLCFTYGMFFLVVNGCYMAYRYRVRHGTLRKNGWPPEHLDGDGDFRKKKDD